MRMCQHREDDALQCGGEWTDMAFFDPFHPRVGTKVFIPYSAYLIEHPAGTVACSTPVRIRARRRSQQRLGSTAETYQIEVAHRSCWSTSSRASRVRPGDVTDIVISHLHYDHAGALERFPTAKVHVQRAEREFAAQPPVYQAGDYVPADFRVTKWNEMDGDTDLFDDGRLVRVATPGHTAGHQSLMVGLEAASGPGRRRRTAPPDARRTGTASGPLEPRPDGGELGPPRDSWPPGTHI